MMRKLVKHGPSTLIVSLPSRWVKRIGLNAKDEVHVAEEENTLIISPEQSKKKEAITVNITTFDRTSLVLLMHALYREGFSKVSLFYDSPTTIHYRTKKPVFFSKIIHELMGRFIGFEISKERENMIEISEISYPDKSEINTIINRSMNLLGDMVKSFCDGLKNNNKIELEHIETKHDSLTKLISYILRAITREGYSTRRTRHSLSHILANIDKIIDIMKYIARDYCSENHNVSKKMHEPLDLFQKAFSEYIRLFFKYDEQKIASISEKRDDFKTLIKGLKFSKEELIMATSLTQALELLFDLSEWRMHLKYVADI